MSKPRPRIQATHTVVVAHMRFVIYERREGWVTFMLYPDVEGAEKRPALFSGFVEDGMATEMRKLAHLFDDICERKKPSTEGVFS